MKGLRVLTAGIVMAAFVGSVTMAFRIGAGQPRPRPKACDGITIAVGYELETDIGESRDSVRRAFYKTAAGGCALYREVCVGGHRFVCEF